MIYPLSPWVADFSCSSQSSSSSGERRHAYAKTDHWLPMGDGVTLAATLRARRRPAPGRPAGSRAPRPRTGPQRDERRRRGAPRAARVRRPHRGCARARRLRRRVLARGRARSPTTPPRSSGCASGLAWPTRESARSASRWAAARVEAARAGTRLAAAVPVTTWTSLYDAPSAGPRQVRAHRLLPQPAAARTVGPRSPRSGTMRSRAATTPRSARSPRSAPSGPTSAESVRSSSCSRAARLRVRHAGGPVGSAASRPEADLPGGLGHAPSEPARRAAVLLRPDPDVVRPVPEGPAERDRHAAADRARAGSVALSHLPGFEGPGPEGSPAQVPRPADDRRGPARSSGHVAPTRRLNETFGHALVSVKASTPTGCRTSSRALGAHAAR